MTFHFLPSHRILLEAPEGARWFVLCVDLAGGGPDDARFLGVSVSVTGRDRRLIQQSE